MDPNPMAIERWLHDAKTPLTVARLKAQFIERSLSPRVTDPEKIKGAVRELLAELDRIKDSLDHFPESE